MTADDRSPVASVPGAGTGRDRRPPHPDVDRGGRVLALDLGARRIGVAASDPGRVLASPYGTIERGGRRADDHRRIAEAVAETGAVLVVVGLPLSLDGSAGPAARDVTAEVGELQAVLDVPVALHDERLTTVQAAKGLRAGGRRSRQQRAVIDREAAAVLLQSWLDGPGSSHG